MDLHVLTHSFPTRRSSALHLLLLQRELQGGVPGEPCRLRHLMAAFGAALVVVLAAGSALVVTRWAGRAVDRAHLTAFERDPFLGGGTIETHAWGRFHVRYYSMALLFLAFRSEARRVGKGCFGACRIRWSPVN